MNAWPCIRSGTGRGGAPAKRRPLRRSDRGWVLGATLILAVLGLVIACALGEVGFQALRSTVRQTQKDIALNAASAGMQRSRLAIAQSNIFSTGLPISFAGTLDNASYSVSVTSIGSGQASVVSTGTAGGINCVLTRTATSPAVVLHAADYTGTMSAWGTLSVLSGREPVQSATRPETPNFSYYRSLAIAQGHYYSGNLTITSALAAGVYFAEGNITVNKTGSLPSVTLVANGDISFAKNNAAVSNSVWSRPVLMAGGTVILAKGNTVTGAIYAGGSLSSDRDLTVHGRINAVSISLNQSCVLTDDSNASVYQQLEGFSYSAVGVPPDYSNWSELY